MSPSTRTGLASGERIVAKEPCAVYKCHTQRYQLAQRYLFEEADVLDFGCGIGYGSFLMSAYCNSVVGVEKDTETVLHANKWFRRANISYINDTHVPTWRKFNVITAFEVIEHVEDGRALMNDFFEALQPRGTLVLSVPNQDTVPFNQSEHEFHWRHYTSCELVDLIESTGFIIELAVNQPSKRFPELMAGFGGWTNMAVCRKP